MGNTMGWIKRILLWMNIAVLIFGIVVIGGGYISRSEYEKNLKLGESYEKEKAYGDAYRQFKRLAEKYPSDPYVLIHYAAVSYRCGKFDEMEETLIKIKKYKADERAIEAFKGLEKLLRSEAIPKEELLSLLAEVDGKPNNVRLKVLQDYCGRNTTDFMGFHLMGNSYMIEEEYLKAIEAYERATSLKPELIPSILNMATAYREIGYYSKAEQLVTRALSFNPESPQAYVVLARIKLETYEDTKAVEYAKKASMELDPSNLDAKAMLTVVTHYAGMQNDSLKFLAELKKENYFDYENLKKIVDGKLKFRQ